MISFSLKIMCALKAQSLSMFLLKSLLHWAGFVEYIDNYNTA